MRHSLRDSTSSTCCSITMLPQTLLMRYGRNFKVKHRKSGTHLICICTSWFSVYSSFYFHFLSLDGSGALKTCSIPSFLYQSLTHSLNHSFHFFSVLSSHVVFLAPTRSLLISFFPIAEIYHSLTHSFISFFFALSSQALLHTLAHTHSLISSFSKDGNTALHEAVLGKKTQVVVQLARFSDRNLRNKVSDVCVCVCVYVRVRVL